MFITPPGETDVLMVVVALILAGSILGFGILFLRLHSLPEHIAHRGHKLQAEIVAVLCLISLFTHMHIFWIVALLLALIDIPDFSGVFGRIAGSVEKMAGIKPGEGAKDVPDPAHPAPSHELATAPPHETVVDIRRGDSARDAASRPELAPASTRG
jgi:hypothetical protein